MRSTVLAVALIACGDNKPSPPEPPADSDVPADPLARCAAPIRGTTVELQRLTKVNDTATLVTAPPLDPRLFILERRGVIRLMERGVLLDEPFLDLSSDADGPIISGFENGLLGLAFHPQYVTNGRFFITYTTSNPGDPDNPQRDVLARCTVSPTDPNHSDFSSCTDVLSIPDFAANHNGGMIEFGQDGYLYWGTGDGGRGGDPRRNGQALDDNAGSNTHALLGKILRLDVDHQAPGLAYDIPAGNPFFLGGGRPEIWIIGVRNPWRWSFDRETGDMWIPDVGEETIEELTVLRPEQQAGANLGWSVFEGSSCFRGVDCDTPTVRPQFERTHAEGWLSIIGGQVYRGSCFPDLVGTYFFTDFDLAGRLVTAKLEADDSLSIVELPNTFPSSITSIHEDAAGELYASFHNGDIFRLVVVDP